MHRHNFVEAQRLHVAQVNFEHGVVHAFSPHFAVGMTDVTQIRHPGLFQVGQVPAVVNNAHGIGFGEPHPDVVCEVVVRGTGRGFHTQAHPVTVAVPRLASAYDHPVAVTDEGVLMAVHPEYQALLDMLAMMSADAPPLSQTTPDMSRQSFTGFIAIAGPGPQVALVEDRIIPGQTAPIPVRMYRPDLLATMSGAVLYFHGGGWVVGDLESHDGICRALCVGAQVVVISVDYRLAPEHPFPAAVEDCWDATRWVAENAAELGVDANRLVVAGDSAGGNLAAVVALLARDHGAPALALQTLVYPAVDGPDGSWASRVDNAQGYLLTSEQMDWFVDHYVPTTMLRSDWRVAPLRAASHVGVAPAHVITAEFDPLRDEGVAYAQVLHHAGVPVQQSLYDGAIHGFFQLQGSELGRRALDEVCDVIRRTIA